MFGNRRIKTELEEARCEGVNWTELVQIKTGLKETKYEGVNWTELVQIKSGLKQTKYESVKWTELVQSETILKQILKCELGSTGSREFQKPIFVRELSGCMKGDFLTIS
jgi:hypothetical protein